MDGGFWCLDLINPKTLNQLSRGPESSSCEIWQCKEQEPSKVLIRIPKSRGLERSRIGFCCILQRNYKEPPTDMVHPKMKILLASIRAAISWSSLPLPSYILGP